MSHVKLMTTGPYASVLQLDGPASPATSQRLADLRARLAATAPPEIRDLVLGFTSLSIEHRPTLSRNARRAWLQRAAARPRDATEGRTRTVRVAYGQEADAQALEARLGMPFDEITALHAAHRPTVAFIGFTPGFPYLLGLPEALHLPRRERPVTRVPAGAVAIAAGRGGIYPSASPSGWWVLGRTDAPLFDPWRDDPAWLGAGDTVSFEPVPADALRSAPRRGPGEDVLVGDDGPNLEVVGAVPGSASLQGRPRWGGGHLGLAQAGALDPLALEAANGMLGNPAHRAALEVLGQPIALRSDVDLTAAVTGGGMSVTLDGASIRSWRAFAWPAGAVLELIPDAAVPGRTALLAVRGGYRAQQWRGSDATDVRAGAGGSARWLQGGDRLPLDRSGTGPPLPHPGRPVYPARVAVHVHPGPQYAPRAFDALVSTAFRVHGVDRTGARLDGPPVPWAWEEIESDGTPWGAVQIPPDGRPIVLLADRGRTGGYPKPAVVDPRDLWRLAQARPGDEVWLLDARRGEARAERLDSDA